MPEDVKIADAPSEATPAWLTQALAPLLRGSRVTAVVAEPIGTGQMCDSVRLALTINGPADVPTSIVGKFPAADDTSRATALALGSYENEVRFYQQLAPTLPVRTPAVYYADIDVQTASFVLLLEDLAPRQQGDQLAGCSPTVAELAVAELVKLHAPRWGDAALADLPWLHRDVTAQRQFLQALLPTLWPGFCERYDTVLDPDVRIAGDTLMARLEPYLWSDTEPWTIIHGDYRLDNLLFHPDRAEPVAVVDWQTCTHGPALQDVAYFVGAGLAADDRRAVEDQLVRGYHAGLLDAGVTDYGWDRCWRDYRRGTWSGLVMAIAASMLVERTDRGDQMFMAMAERHAHHALDLDAADVITP